MELRLIFRESVTPAGEHGGVLLVSIDDHLQGLLRPAISDTQCGADPTTRAVIETSFQLEIITVRHVDDVARYLDLC